MKRFLRSQLQQRAPALFNGIRAIRNRRYFRRTFSKHNADFREKLFPRGAAITVQSGPFKGMRYLDETVWGSITPKWLGSYEAEIHPIVARIVEHSYDTIIDVGCAEGYYAVGLARAIAAANVYAFDIDFISRAQVRRLAILNNVIDRLQIRALCNHSDLDALSRGDTLVVCDTEGFEARLLNPGIASSLRHDDILVEVHETSASASEIERLLRSRFERSHRIERLIASSRDSWIEENRQHFSISDDALRDATEESRTTGRLWLWMEAKTKEG
jgi:hypothetical protein